MDRCIVREGVQKLRRQAADALRLNATTNEQKLALERLVKKCDDALSRANKRGRLETPFAEPPFEFLDAHPEIELLMKESK